MDKHIEELKAKKPKDLKSRSSVLADYVTDDNTGGYFVVECENCGEVFPSQKLGGGGAIADTGDYDDSYCPHCNEADPDECYNAGLVWNIQQAKINALLAKLEAAEKLNPLAVNVSELESTYIGDIRLHMAAISDWKQRAEAAEARLLVPVKLPKYCERYHWSDGVFNFKEDIIEAIRKAGYPVEGDE